MTKNIINVQISDLTIPIYIRENARSRRLTLKLHPKDGLFHLTAPPRAKQQDILAFIQRSRPWLEKMSAHQKLSTPFQEGQIIPVLGQNLMIRYAYADKPSVHTNDDSLQIFGFDPIIIPGLTKDWLRSHIFKYLTETSQDFALHIQKEITSISIKDTKTRWGSCSRDGNLCYSWRLVFAPEEVAKYVCAHEVAHLVEMNHSPAFWDIVEDLFPAYKIHRAWLKANGRRLFTFG